MITSISSSPASNTSFITLINLIFSIIFQEKTTNIILTHEQDSIALVTDLLSSKYASNFSWYIINEHLIDNKFNKNLKIPNRDLSAIILLSNVTKLSQFLNNSVTKSIPNPRYNSLLIFTSDSQPSNDIVQLCWNYSLVNVGLIFLIHDTDISVFTYNPFVDMNLLEIWNTTENSLLPESIPNELHRHIFYNKLMNLNGIKIPIMVGLDLASVYRKFNPNRYNDDGKRHVGLGGMEVNAMEIISKSMNAHFLYKSQDQSNIRNETNQLNVNYLHVLSEDLVMPFDKSEPINFDIIRTAEENA